MNNDTELLRRYVEDSSEGAFTELVHEHLNLVYGAALRETGGDGALAEDVSQAVFTELARKARKLLSHPTLAGWLYTTVRHLAANLRRADHRRRCREEEAQSMNEPPSDGSAYQEWQQIRPVLDDALHELNETDRVAVVLRFLENRTLREVGVQLGLQENAARMRVDRALEKLRGLLARRGITSTAASLSAALVLGVVTPTSTTLAATIACTALATGGAAASATLTLMKLMSLTKVTLIATVVVAGIAVPVWQQTRVQRLQSENAELRAQAAELASARRQVPRPQTAGVDSSELERLRQWQAQAEPELLRLRGMAGVARRAMAEADQLRAQLARQSSEAATNPISGAMADAMKQAMEQQVAGRLSRLTATLHLTPEQMEAARAILQRQSDAMSAGMQQALSGKVNKEEILRMGKAAGNPDEQIKTLLTPDQQAAYPGYQKEEAAHNARLAANTELLQLQATLGLTADQQDRAFAALYDTSYNQLMGSAKPPPTTNQAETMQWMLDEKAKALAPVLTPTQMDTYRQQLALQTKLVKDLWTKMDGANPSP